MYKTSTSYYNLIKISLLCMYICVICFISCRVTMFARVSLFSPLRRAEFDFRSLLYGRVWRVRRQF